MSETNDVERLTAERENATIHATAARNGLALAELREKNLRAENKRLKAELAREREECERLKSLVTDMGGDPRSPEPMPLMENDAGHVPCCSVCGGLGGTLKDADAPVRAHLPPLLRSGAPCPGSGKPATLGAPEQPWARATPVPSDKPAEPVPGVAAKEPTYAEVCAAASQLQAMVRNGPVVVDPVGSLYDPNRCTARNSRTGARCSGSAETPHVIHARMAGGETERRIEALEERVEALEDGAKAEAPRRIYRVQYNGSWEGMERLAAPTEYWGTAKYRCDGLPGSWLEVSEDNGRTWKRYKENDNAE